MINPFIIATALLIATIALVNPASARDSSADLRRLCGKFAEIHEKDRLCSWGTRMAPWKFALKEDPITGAPFFEVVTVNSVASALLSFTCSQSRALNVSVLMLGRVLSLTGEKGKLGKEVDVPVAYRIDKSAQVQDLWRTGKFEARDDTRRDLILGAMTKNPGQAAVFANALSKGTGAAAMRLDGQTITFKLEGSAHAIRALRKNCKF